MAYLGGHCAYLDLSGYHRRLGQAGANIQSTNVENLSKFDEKVPLWFTRLIIYCLQG